MGRRRSFDEEVVLDVAAQVFVRGGYEGTSIDDLVKSLNLHRGSLYQAFGSKRRLFLLALRRHVETTLAELTREPAALAPGAALDLVLVAALERGPVDAEVAALVRRAVAMLEQITADPADGSEPVRGSQPPHRVFALLGARLYERLDSAPPPTHEPPIHRT